MFLGQSSAGFPSEGHTGSVSQTAPVTRSGPGRLAVAALLAVLWTVVPAPAQAADCQALGGIGEYWRSVGGESSFLGPCLTGELPVAGGVVQHFRGGSVFWSPATGAHSVHGAIREAYDASGGPGSRLGFPTTSETPTPARPGAYNHFAGGSIYWSPATGAHLVVGGIRETWARLGWENSPLGFPRTDEMPVPGGAASGFEGGSVLWTPGTGAHAVWGAIRERWSAFGAEGGRLGFPTTSELPTPVKAGAYNHFQGGSVYWSQATGARMVIGAIRERWASLGWENSSLGFPVSDEYTVPGGARSDFSGGSITWDARTGAVDVLPGGRPSFTFSVSPVTAGDLPSTYRAGCPVPPQDLRLLRMAHVDFAGSHRIGEMVVHADQALPVLRVFARLHEARFLIARMERVDVFGGSDAASMDANNTSAFNCRRTTSGTVWSEHAYGRAVDVNPVQNPYVSGSTVLPEAGRAYLDRSFRRPGMVVAGDAAVQAFAASGWGWGGAWTGSKDYQHFSRSGR